MGTESHFPIGTVFKRRKPQDDLLDELVVVGGGKALVVRSNTEFGPSFELTGQEVNDEYDVDAAEGGELSAPTVNYNTEPSPEEVFAKLARDNPVKVKPRRGRAPAPPTPEDSDESEE